MAGAYILYNDNIVNGNASLAVTNSGAGTSMASATLPLVNVKDRRVAKVARIIRSGTADTTLTAITFTGMTDSVTGLGLQARAVAIIGEKWTPSTPVPSGTPAANWRIKAYSYLNTLLHDSGATPLLASAQPGYPPILFYVFPTQIAVQKLEISFTIPVAGYSDGYLDVGRVFLSDVIELPAGVDAQIDIASADASRVLRSRGQQIYAETVPRYRLGTYRITQISEQLAINTLAGGAAQPSFQSLAMQAGSSGEVIVAPRTSDEHVKRRLTIYGRLTKPPVINHQGGGYYATQLDVEEGL